MKNFNWKHTLGPGIIYIFIMMHLPWQQCTIRVQHLPTTKHFLFKSRKKKSQSSTGLIRFALIRLNFRKFQRFCNICLSEVHCLHFNWGGKRMICLEQSGSTPFPSDLQELLQGVRAVQLWVLQCVVLEESWQTWSHSGYFSPFSFFFFLFLSVFYERPVSPMHTVMDSVTSGTRNAGILSQCCDQELLEQLKFSPQREFEHLWSPRGCAVLSPLLTGDSHPWSTPCQQWSDSCKSIHNQFTFSVPLDSHTQMHAL